MPEAPRTTVSVTVMNELLDYARQQADKSVLLDVMPLPRGIDRLSLWINNLIIKEVAQEVKATHPDLRGDCGEHVCRNCGTRWGD